MHARCYDSRHKHYPRYGGRGIRVCEAWHSFEPFFADMGHRPTTKHSLDRIDNDGNYEPGNCRWATNSEQQRNRSSTRMIEFGGRRLSMAAWAEQTGLKLSTLCFRLAHGWSIERALTERCR